MLRCVECRGKVDHEGYVEKIAKDMKRNCLCYKCRFWNELIKIRDEPNVVRVDGKHYMIYDGELDPPGKFGHQRYFIQFFGGPRIMTVRLRRQGTIPEHFRDRLPDNARFEDINDYLTEERYKKMRKSALNPF